MHLSICWCKNKNIQVAYNVVKELTSGPRPVHRYSIYPHRGLIIGQMNDRGGWFGKLSMLTMHRPGRRNGNYWDSQNAWKQCVAHMGSITSPSAYLLFFVFFNAPNCSNIITRNLCLMVWPLALIRIAMFWYILQRTAPVFWSTHWSAVGVDNTTNTGPKPYNPIGDCIVLCPVLWDR